MAGNPPPTPELAKGPNGPSPPKTVGGTASRSCPACLTENPAHFLFCQACGRLLPRTAADGKESAPTLPSFTSEELGPTLMPTSIALVRAARATRYDSASIRLALEAVEAASRKLQALTQQPGGGSSEEFAWERTPQQAESSSLIEGAAALLALAAAPETRDGLRALFVRRAYWVLQVASDRTQALLEKGGR